ncbi:hypothetical protein [Rhizobium sp. M1]|uniref:hypothetical protein n=1 Tax=Rhizobium sp. M1 TaxID=2035453 RepID=UPI000BE92E53|nr:hypothetical protein [Rhizobium sp. M1]PDT09780.1 hypothetical protein CO655_16430 [Rhizobium sp. M1]
MQELTNSRAWRRKDEAPNDTVIADWLAGDIGDELAGVVLRFDIGSENRHEYIGVDISPLDYAALMTEMIDNNRKAFLDAVGRVLVLRSMPVDPI